MKCSSVAPCGLICDLCYAFQRPKNRCEGCNSSGNKTSYCEKCRIKQCPEKADEYELCNKCAKYPCRIIKNLDKRYSLKYGESAIANLDLIKEKGIRAFIKDQKAEWKCPRCGNLLCVHKTACQNCGHSREMGRQVCSSSPEQ